MNKENLERLIEKAEDFVIKKGKKKINKHYTPKDNIQKDYLTTTEDITYRSKGLILKYREAETENVQTKSFEIAYKKMFKKEKTLYRVKLFKMGNEEERKTQSWKKEAKSENYLSPISIKELEKILYKK
ncbi:MAG: hypothetical protein NUV46_03805 [Nanoarchaeota archaeon]|nr:hypothetical protein [Nanoarchaeota archaeon]